MGQPKELSIKFPTIITIITILVTALSTFFTTQLATEAKIYNIREESAKQGIIVDNLRQKITDIDKGQERLESKIDALLLRQGLNLEQFK